MKNKTIYLFFIALSISAKLFGEVVNSAVLNEIESSDTAQLIEISSVEEFKNAMEQYAAIDCDIKLLSDLDFTNSDYVQCNFYGKLDGNNKTITGLKCALFVDLYGEVKNLRFANIKSTTKRASFALIAECMRGAIIQNCEIENVVCSYAASNARIAGFAAEATTNSEGVVSRIYDCTVKNSSFEFTGGSANFIGGIVAIAKHATIKNCAFIGLEGDDISLGNQASFVGGIVGGVAGSVNANVTITSSLARGNISASCNNITAGVGGIVGRVDAGAIVDLQNVTNYAKVEFSDDGTGVGGIIGRAVKCNVSIKGAKNYGEIFLKGKEESPHQSGNSIYGCGAGGIIGGFWISSGPSYNVAIENSANYGTISAGYLRHAGGIIGHACTASSQLIGVTISNAVNHGAVSAHNNAGGLIGFLYKPKTTTAIVNSGNTANVTATTGYAGGMIGALEFAGYNNYKDFEMTGIANILNSGAIIAESAKAGELVGCMETPENNAYIIKIESPIYLAHENLEIVAKITGKEASAINAINSYPIRDSASLIRSAVKRLNVYATANMLPHWVREKDYPELSLFSNGRVVGTFIAVQ